ncbi:MAG TPA: autotransporter-associated beta strand repeat-containing protein [Chthoniobacteraceae bacterium]|nr:autotransporter-associated beta strand repeat-containing protein [Chthoniobacteraceae bacterium]
MIKKTLPILPSLAALLLLANSPLMALQTTWLGDHQDLWNDDSLWTAGRPTATSEAHFNDFDGLVSINFNQGYGTDNPLGIRNAGALTKTGEGFTRIGAVNDKIVGVLRLHGLSTTIGDESVTLLIGNFGTDGVFQINGPSTRPLELELTVTGVMHADRSIILNAPVTGNGGIIKTGSSSLQFFPINSTVFRSNTYTGGFTLREGVVRFADSGTANENPFGAGTLTLENGTVQSYNDGTLTRTLWNPIVLAGTIQLGSADTAANNADFITDASNSQTTTLTADSTLTLHNTTTWKQAISGDFELAKAGAGTLILEGENTYSGATSVEAGAFHVSGSLDNAQVTVADGGAFSLLEEGILRFQITSATEADRFTLESGGNALFDGTLDLAFGQATENATWQLFDGTAAGDFTNLEAITLSGAFEGALSLTGLNLWEGTLGDSTFVFQTDTGLLSVTTIPEPGTLSALLLGMAILGAVRFGKTQS